jgi:hypothetical protein
MVAGLSCSTATASLSFNYHAVTAKRISGQKANMTAIYHHLNQRQNERRSTAASSKLSVSAYESQVLGHEFKRTTVSSLVGVICRCAEPSICVAPTTEKPLHAHHFHA